MATRDIPRNRWREELDSFSRQHEGWIVRVRRSDSSGRWRTEAEDLPLQGVTADSPREHAVAIMVGEKPGAHLTHEIPEPDTIAIDQTDAGSERALRIRARDGSTTEVEFRSPARSERVDGVPRRER